MEDLSHQHNALGYYCYSILRSACELFVELVYYFKAPLWGAGRMPSNGMGGMVGARYITRPNSSMTAGTCSEFYFITHWCCWSTHLWRHARQRAASRWAAGRARRWATARRRRRWPVDAPPAAPPCCCAAAAARVVGRRPCGRRSGFPCCGESQV